MIFSNLILNMRPDCCFHCFKNFIARVKSSNRLRSFSVVNANRIKQRSFQHSSMLLKVHIIGPQPRLNPTSYRLFHSVKGWKSVVKPENDGDDAEHDPADAPCEEGTGAVAHSDLLSQLNECRSVQDQLTTLNSTLGLTSEDIANRTAFCNFIASVLEPYFPDYRIHLFGSSVNGLGFKGCDIDLSIETTFDVTAAEGYIRMEVPNLDDVLDGKVLKSDVIRQHPKLLLRYIRRIFRRHGSSIREPIFLIKARCPILRFYDEKFDLFCDFSCENKAALRNTKLLRFLTHMDDRIAILAKTLRYLGKYGKFVGDIDMFNSYAFTLLIVYFLQNTTPAVIPPLEEILSKAEYVVSGDVLDDELMYKGLKMIPSSKNKQSIDELLKEFFHFYLYFDFGQAMLPLTSFSACKQDFKSDEDPPTDTFERSTICVQDPFRRSFNATSGAAYKTCRKFLGIIIDTCKLFENPNMWIPSSENWGVSTIFASTSPEVWKERIFEVNKCETLEIPITSATLRLTETCEDAAVAIERHNQQIAKCLKNIFEHCLLFKCSSLFIPQRNKTRDGQILKLKCAVTHNTWSGRYLALREHFSNGTIDNVSDLEHQLSTHLAKQKKSNEVLFKSICNCYLTQKDGQTVLKLYFVLEQGRIPPIVTMFLQDYVPKMLKELL